MIATITYDQPLNEIIRVCLRLEQLFLQIDHQLSDTSMLGTRNIITTIIQILHIVDRPDLKSKLAKELSQLLANLRRYNNAPTIDADKLNKLTQQLEEMSHHLIDSNVKIGYRLRDVELLNVLRLHLATPGGGCNFDVPLYYCWLKQPTEVRLAIINGWLKEFAQIRATIELVLDLVRKNAKTEEKMAIHGFHQELLDPQSNLRMIRIKMSCDIAAYPETSLGRHFLSVRYFYPDIQKRPTQYAENVPFVIDYCYG